MYKIAILGAIQQQAEALSTRCSPIYVLFNDMVYFRNKDEMVSSDKVIYKRYSAHNTKEEISILYRLLKEISPDVVYTNGFGQLWMVSLIIHEPGWLSTKPIVLVTSHNSLAWQTAYKRFMMALFCHFLADGIFTLATFQEKWLRKLGISHQKITTIPNAVDIEQFTPVGSRDFFAGIFSEYKNSPIIVNIANMDQFKGQDTLIKCIDKVKYEENNVRLVLMGIQYPDSKYNRLLKNLIIEYGLKKNVFILGKIDNSQIPEVLRSSNISVISSRNE